MNQDQIKGSFDQLKVKIKQTWCCLSDDDIALANGQRDQFLGKLHQTYGLTKKDGETRLGELEKDCNYTPSEKAA